LIIVTSPLIALSIADADVRRLVLTRFNQITAGETYDYDRHGEIYTPNVARSKLLARNGEVTLAPAVGSAFDGTSLPTGWTGSPWAGGALP